MINATNIDNAPTILARRATNTGTMKNNIDDENGVLFFVPEKFVVSLASNLPPPFENNRNRMQFRREPCREARGGGRANGVDREQISLGTAIVVALPLS